MIRANVQEIEYAVTHLPEQELDEFREWFEKYEAALPDNENGVESQRPFGLCKGEFRVPDDFDAPLPEYILKEFEG